MGVHRNKLRILALSCLLVLASSNPPAHSQGAGGFAPINIRPQGNIPVPESLAQVPPPSFIPTDLTPIGIGIEQDMLSPGYLFWLLKRLPTRAWANITTEVSQRFESNALFTARNPRRDYAFRVLPNVTLGYNFYKHTSIYCNYFVIKDLYAENGGILNFPTTQSLSVGLKQDVPIGTKTNLQFDFQARELWQTAHLNQADLIPAVTMTYVLNPRTILFGNLLLQMRSHYFFQGATREIDPFYTWGGLYRRGNWTFSATDTLVTNFRSPPFNDSVPRQGNVSMILALELARPVSKRFPALVEFVRAEPIWNWASRGTPGLSGFDFRLFGGLRLAMAKSSYGSSIEKLRKQLQETQDSDDAAPPPSSSAAPEISPSVAMLGTLRLLAENPEPASEALQVEPDPIVMKVYGARVSTPITSSTVDSGPQSIDKSLVSLGRLRRLE